MVTATVADAFGTIHRSDHACMRSKQLSSLLLLMSGEGVEHFSCLNIKAQDSLLWLARQLAVETEAMFDIVLADQDGGVA